MSDMVTELAGERHVAAVWMHSGTDYMGIGPWANGRLLRAVSMSSADGIIENVGEPLSFEAPFWEGRRPVIHLSNYPLPFHPLGMGSEALRELFGFVLEGRIDADCVDVEDLQVPTFTQVAG
ncbi:hypothetical protein J2S57_005928 [Kineosporia succinea]|uniref:Uncharacterized protein n=1 Tax=Kineosporia succinea TaxID=84632 RepID=A0ABT9PBU4_9ACTN|nr:hypothetical protein [Kineosporia succinea]MDP9830179.1 hypothetical protein [Kineosporia succinea]